MAVLREPYSLEMRADGTLRDPDNDEIYGRVPVRFRDLYAAAPDLLAACEEFVAYQENDCQDDLRSWAKIQDMMRAAIAKARGK